ncbi:MAG: phosphatidate cytidylyltransferase [Rhodothermia bacterium]
MTDSRQESRSLGVVRILTALVGGPLVLLAAYLGNFWFAGLVLAIGVVAMLEVGTLFASAGLRPFLPVSLVLAVLVVARYWFPDWGIAATVLITGTVAAMPFVPGQRVPERTATTFFVVLYPVWLLSFLLNIRLGLGIDRSDDQLMRMTVLVFFLVWANDTFAFYSGRKLGSRPFFASVSPAKTWEGFLGGLIGTALVAVLSKVLGLIDITWGESAVLVAICGIGGPIGDLVESKMKRSFEVKDSGTLLPGHGGMLDRFDAILICGPLIWLYLAYVW